MRYATCCNCVEMKSISNALRYAGTLRSLSRNCSPVALPSSCLVGTDKSTKEPLKVCYTTCSEDGCNWKSSLKQLLNLLWSSCCVRSERHPSVAWTRSEETGHDCGLGCDSNGVLDTSGFTRGVTKNRMWNDWKPWFVYMIMKCCFVVVIIQINITEALLKFSVFRRRYFECTTWLF